MSVPLGILLRFGCNAISRAFASNISADEAMIGKPSVAGLFGFSESPLGYVWCRLCSRSGSRCLSCRHLQGPPPRLLLPSTAWADGKRPIFQARRRRTGAIYTTSWAVPSAWGNYRGRRDRYTCIVYYERLSGRAPHTRTSRTVICVGPLRI